MSDVEYCPSDGHRGTRDLFGYFKWSPIQLKPGPIEALGVKHPLEHEEQMILRIYRTEIRGK